VKIHLIETVNLNSLYGAQKVDLDDALAGESLFLIYGPTGSGKSTLMDAVSLALFGATPRLNAKQGNAAFDPRAIMSRGTWQCSATVVFSKLEDGARQAYRATWTCERAWKKPDGRKKTPTRSLERLALDKPSDILVSSDIKKEFAPVFKKVLEGFGVEDFNRSMLLAQGQFDAFLGAPPAQRAEILERLTDTSIYQRLGQRAARIRGRHAGRLAALRTLAAAGGGLDADALQALEQADEQVTGEHQQLARRHKSASGHLSWFDLDAQQRDKLAQAQAEEKQLNADAGKAAPELTRLTAHERCQGEKAFQLFDLHGSAQKQRESHQGKIDLLDQSLPSLHETARDKKREATEAAATAGSAVSHLEALRPLAETTDKTAAAASAAARLAQETAEAQGAAGAVARNGQQALDEATEAVATAKTAAASSRTALEANADNAKLAAEWGPLRSQLDQVVARSDRLGSDADALKLREEDLTQEWSTLTQDQATYKASHKTEMEPAERARKDAMLALTGLQSQVGFEASREEAAGAAERARIDRDALTTAKSTVAAARKGATKLETGRDLIGSLTEALDRKQAALVALAPDVERLAQLESQASAALDRTKRVASLVGHRVALEDGESCPLCGSDEHPWADDPDRAAADAEISETVAAAERVRDEARTAHQAAERVHRATEGDAQDQSVRLELLRGQQDDAAAEQVRLDQPATSDLAATGLGADSTVEAVDEALRDATRRWNEARTAVDALDTARRDLDVADKGLRAAIEASKDTEAALRDRATALHERRQQLQVNDAEHAEALSKQRSEQAACSTLLREHGLEIVEDDPTGWRDLGDTRCREHAARVKAVTDREAQVTTQETARVGKEELLAEQIKRRDDLIALQGQQEADREEKLSEATRARGALDEEWKASARAYPERDLDTLPARDSTPSELLKAQKTWVKRTEDAAQKTDLKHQDARALVEDAGTRRQTLDEQRTEFEAARIKARAALDAALQALDLTVDDALTTARLDDGLLADLRAKRKQLDDRRVAVQTRMTERSELVEAHKLIRPRELPQEPERDDLAAAVEASKDLVDLAAVACQEIGDRLRDHHRAVQEQKANRGALREAEKEARVWQTLHEYIGVNDGGKFKQFAQALNLGQLLEKANVHLARLTRRYRLISRLEDGLPTLEFDLSDLWQVGERVAPPSLSGGERFLVSLSLALGLSDFRAVKMPIETLLLDEGFGTLDQDTLSVALAALSQLQADGRQVGIISHVVGLREKIPARIEVRPLGGGRSEAITRA
jgi:exonuclease SbcC